MDLALEEAWQDLFAAAWATIDQQVADALDFPDWQTPEDWRRRLGRAFRRRGDVRNHDPRNPSHRQLLAQAFLGDALPDAKAAAQGAVRMLASWDTRTLNRMRRRFRVKDVPKAKGRRPRHVQKADARNLTLLSFVVERIIPFAQLLVERRDENGRDTRLRPGHRGPNVAVPRQALAEEWSRTHPYDAMSSGDVLMGQYYRAAARHHLCDELLTQLSREVREAWEDDERMLQEMRQWYAGLTEEERAERFRGPAIQISEEDWKPVAEAQEKLRRARARLRACFPSEEAFQKREAELDREREEQYRVSLTRKDLIAERVRRLVWLLPDKEPEEEVRLWQSPLRAWFLPEARGEPVPRSVGDYESLRSWLDRRNTRRSADAPSGSGSSQSKATRRPTSAKSARAAKKKVAQSKRKQSAKRKSAPKKRTSRPSR